MSAFVLGSARRRPCGGELRADASARDASEQRALARLIGRAEMLGASRTASTTARVPLAEMPAHSFTYAGLSYEVRFHRMDGQWLATLYVSGSNHGKPLLPAPDDIAASTSDASVRAGYIGVAKWLVTTGRWPDWEIRARGGSLDLMNSGP